MVKLQHFSLATLDSKLGCFDMEGTVLDQLWALLSKLEGWERVFLFVGLVGGLVVWGWVLGITRFVDWWDNRRRWGRVVDLWLGPGEWNLKVLREGGKGGGRGRGGGGRGGVKVV